MVFEIRRKNFVNFHIIDQFTSVPKKNQRQKCSATFRSFKIFQLELKIIAQKST